MSKNAKLIVLRGLIFVTKIDYIKWLAKYVVITSIMLSNVKGLKSITFSSQTS